jgi:hypothetical protein
LAAQLTRNISDTLGVTESPDNDSSTVVAERSWSRPDPVAGAHRRKVASQIGLDVYSRNPKMQEFLDAVVTVRESGQMRPGMAMVPTPRYAKRKIAGGQIDRQIEKLLRRLSAAEVD